MGSSSSSRSGSANSAAASATRMRQPPENSAIGAVEIGVGKAQAGQDFGGARRGAVGVDLDQPRVDVGEPLGLGGFQFGVSAPRARVSAARIVSSRLTGVAGCSWSTEPMRARLRQPDLAAVRGELAQDQLEQGRFADAVAADQADLGAGRNGHAGRIEEAAPPGVENKIVDLKHSVWPTALPDGAMR